LLSLQKGGHGYNREKEKIGRTFFLNVEEGKEGKLHLIHEGGLYIAQGRGEGKGGLIPMKNKTGRGGNRYFFVTGKTRFANQQLGEGGGGGTALSLTQEGGKEPHTICQVRGK